MKYFFRLFIPLFCFLLVRCSLLPSEMKIAEQIIETNPDSALYILQHVHPNQTFTDADQAIYGLLLFKALDKHKLPLKPDSIINFSLNYYQNTNDKLHLAICCFYKARMFKYAQHYEEATALYLKALDNLQDQKDYDLLGKIYGDMGDICFVQEDYKDALEKYKLAADNFNKAGKIIDVGYRLLDIGRTYNSVRDYKTAHKYYRKSLILTKDSTLMGSALQDIGSIFFYAKQYDSAQYYLRQSLYYPYFESDYSVRCFTLADLYYEIKQYDSVYYYASIALKQAPSIYIQRECYRLMANTSYMKGDFKSMANFMTSFQVCTDSIRSIESQTKISVLEGIHQISQKAGKSKQYFIILAWIIPVILIISLFIFYKLRNRNKVNEEELVQIEQKLKEKQYLLRANLIQKISETKAQQNSIYKKISLAEREELHKEVYNKCLHLNNWDEFSKLINHVYNNLIYELESNYPDITQKEITLCCLFLLDVPTPDVLLVLDYKLDSLYKLKQRLIQKLNLKNAKELDLFLEDLVEIK